MADTTPRTKLAKSDGTLVTDPTAWRDTALTPVAGYQQLTLSGSAATLTVPATATIAVINIEAGSARYRDDGTNATASTGFLLPAGTTISVTLASLAAVTLAKDSGATSATANVLYYR